MNDGQPMPEDCLLPTYDFAEVIEFIRTGGDREIGAIRTTVVEEAKRYCIFHLELIARAFQIRDLVTK